MAKKKATKKEETKDSKVDEQLKDVPTSSTPGMSELPKEAQEKLKEIKKVNLKF